MRLSANRRRKLLKLGSILVLLLAVMPQVLYLGHPGASDGSQPVTRTMPTGHEHHEQAAAEHAGHCHVAPKGCAAADGVSNVASFETALELLESGQTATAVETTPLPRGFALWQRPEKPPRTI
jgi:hypothetical protein